MNATAKLSRRGFFGGALAGASGAFAIGAATEAGGIAFERKVLVDDTIDPTALDVTDIRLAEMQRNAIAHARDIAAETGGLNADWWEKARRAGVHKHATRVRRRDDGKLIIVEHGPKLVLWGDDAPEAMRGVALDDQPDKKFGRFADRRMWQAMIRRKPFLEACRAETYTKPGDRPERIEYYAWTLSDGAEAVSVALTLEQIAQARSRG